jgi:hypothetical protein
MVRWDAVATGGACLSASLGFTVCVYIGALLWSSAGTGVLECEVGISLVKSMYHATHVC